MLVTLSLAVWQDACGEDKEESCEEEHQSPSWTISYVEEVKEGFWGLGFGEAIEIRLLNILHQSSLACAPVASVPFARKQKASMTATSSYRSGALSLYWEKSFTYVNMAVNF